MPSTEQKCLVFSGVLINSSNNESSGERPPALRVPRPSCLEPMALQREGVSRQQAVLAGHLEKPVAKAASRLEATPGGRPD